MKKRGILCFGKSVYDMLLSDVPYDLMEQDGSSASRLTVSSGGDALNASINLTALGDDAALCTMVGNDSFGRLLTRRVEAVGVDTRYVRICEDDSLQTSVSILLLDPDGDVHINNVSGCIDAVTADFVTDEMMQAFSHLHFCSIYGLKQLVGDELAGLFSRAKAKGMTVSMDAKRVNPKYMTLEGLLPCLPYCDIFMPSHDEMVTVTGLTDVQEMKELFRPYGLKIFGVKMGAEGLFVTDYKQDIMMPSFVTGPVVDPSGAGDATVSAFISGFLRGYDMETCAAMAMAQASFIVGVIGANTNVPSFEEVRQVAAKHGYALGK